jgi:hypothetical protein
MRMAAMRLTLNAAVRRFHSSHRPANRAKGAAAWGCCIGFLLLALEPIMWRRCASKPIHGT